MPKLSDLVDRFMFDTAVLQGDANHDYLVIQTRAGVDEDNERSEWQQITSQTIPISVGQ